MRVRVVCLMGITWHSQQVEAQPAAVRAVADSFYAAVERADWASAARFLDSAAVGRRLRERIQRARAELPMSRPTVESLMAADTTLPRAVAEWRIRDMARWPERRFRDYSDEYAGISSFEALLALSVEEAGARWLEAMDPTSRIRRMLRERGCDTRSFESIQAHLFRLRTLGSLVADSARAYVLAETAAKSGGGPARGPGVTSCGVHGARGPGMAHCANVQSPVGRGDGGHQRVLGAHGHGRVCLTRGCTWPGGRGGRPARRSVGSARPAPGGPAWLTCPASEPGRYAAIMDVPP